LTSHNARTSIAIDSVVPTTMLRFITIRLLQFPLILGVVYVLTFALAWVAPGSPFEGERKLNPAVVERLKRDFHAESQLKFLGYYPLRTLTERDFGPSFEYPEWSVNDIIASALPVSVSLGLLALVIACVAGLAAGVLAAVRRGGPFDLISLGVALVGISLPSFVTAGVLLLAFAVHLRWFPIGGFRNPYELFLPALALSLMPMAYIARLMRVSMIDTLGSDYVRTARAKGLSRTMVIWKHCVRNAFLPVLSYLGPAAAYTLTGSFVVEAVFNVPGLGQHFINSVKNRDQTLILGTVMIYSAFLLSLNLMVDVLYVLVDPRIDVTAKSA
jgi:oligopeptide transport system permease protein